MLAVILSAAVVEGAGAAPIRVYDPALSLRGSCSISAVDSISDPGCPGGPHPAKPFFNVCGVVTDSYGDVYVASSTVGTGEAGRKGRIDVFSPAGEYLAEIKDNFRPCDLAVDSEGNLYVLEHEPHELEPAVVTERVVLFNPSTFPPQPGVQYPDQSEAVVVYQNPGSRPQAIAVDPANDHLYMRTDFDGIFEYAAASENPPGGEWTPLREEIGTHITDVVLRGGLDVSGDGDAIYSFGFKESGGPEEAYVVDSSENVLCSTDGSDTPAGHFSFIGGNAAIAVDQSDGSFYVDDTHVNKAIDHFNANCEFIDQLPSDPPDLQQPDFRAGLAVNAPCVEAGSAASCDSDGYHSPVETEDAVYVGSGESEGDSHLFAFPLREPGAPEVSGQRAGQVSDSGARLSASLNPHAVETHYRFEIIAQANYEADGEDFGSGARSAPVPDADVGSGASPISVSVPVAGLAAGTTYRFRLVASSCGEPNAIEGECLTQGEGSPGEEGADRTFTTYLAPAAGPASSRGYELVTPPTTGGYVPTVNELGFSGIAAGSAFETDFATAQGDGLIFGIEGGSLPGFPGGGFHDTYEAQRESIEGFGRWRTSFNGLPGEVVREPTPNGFSADHGSSFWAVVKGAQAEQGNYIRRAGGVLDSACAAEPGGDLEFIGCGSLGTDPYASGAWISPNAGHVVFSTVSVAAREAQKLEPAAAPKGVGSVYDRTSDGVTHVVSLKQDGGSFGGGETAHHLGVSADGTAVAFEVAGAIYVRLDNQSTVKVSDEPVRFGGISRHGDRVAYLVPDPSEPLVDGKLIPQGKIFVCDVRKGPCATPGTQVGTGAKSVLVNFSADGSHVYFSEEDDLFAWDGSGTEFIAHLDPTDVIGRPGHGERLVGGLGLWVPYAVAPDPEPWAGPASDPSRTTPDGSVFVFESRANLTGYDSAGHSEIYRYDPADGLSCLSCNPTGIAAGSDAQLESDPPAQFFSLPPVNALSRIANVTDNGGRVFFQSAERLVLNDTDKRLDVYEWLAPGEAGCARGGGCVRLVSSGQSSTDDYLYATTPNGRDVFFESGDRLVPRDLEAAPSIYDAREGGGETPPVATPAPCQGEACQPLAATPPEEIVPASSRFVGSGSSHPGRGRGRRVRARRHGRRRCAVTKHRHRRRRGHRRAHAKRGAKR